MNDKLILHFKPHQYKQSKKVDNYFTTHKIEPPKFKILSNDIIKQFCNTDNLNADINGYGLKVSFNPNKINGYKYNTHPLTYKEFENAIKETQENLYNIGIDTNITVGNIIRYDTSFDIILPQNYIKYEPLISTLANTTKPLRRGKNRMQSNTLYVGNKSNEIAIYDKTKEQELSENVIRIENRHLKIKTKNKIQLSTVTPEKFKLIRTQDKKQIQQVIFNKNPYLMLNEANEFMIELLTSDLTRSQMYKEHFIYGLINLQSNHPYLTNSFLKTSKTSNNYQRNNRINNDLQQNLYTSGNNIIQTYQELKTLFQKAI